MITPLCFCSKALSQGSCIDWPGQLLPMHISKGDQTLATLTEGDDETPLLLQATIQLTTESARPLPSGNQQKNGYYKRMGVINPISASDQVQSF
jgi:hypothetical protein